jgi:hypothetical protein
MEEKFFNKRHACRHVVELPALLDTCWEERVPVRLKNFSTTGAYFAGQAAVGRNTPVSVSCILSIPPVIPCLFLPRLQGRVVRTDCGGFAILLRKNHIISFVDIGFFCGIFQMNPLPCAGLSWMV